MSPIRSSQKNPAREKVEQKDAESFSLCADAPYSNDRQVRKSMTPRRSDVVIVPAGGCDEEIPPPFSRSLHPTGQEATP